MTKSVMQEELVDLHFPVRGDAVASDHGYPLYAALCRELPEAHGAAWLRVHPIRGERIVSGALRLRDYSGLTLRVPLDRIGLLLPLVGRVLDVGGARLALRAPSIVKLEGSDRLDARLVALKLTAISRKSNQTIDKVVFERVFRLELQRQLDALEVSAEVSLTGRQQITVGGKRVLGFSVRLEGLTPDQSLRLQHDGVGGKRRMGCGVFVPTRGLHS